MLANQLLESSKNSTTNLPYEKLSKYINKGNETIEELSKQEKDFQSDMYLDYINIHHSIQDLVNCGITSYEKIHFNDAHLAFSKVIHECNIINDFDKLMKSIAYLYIAKSYFKCSTRMEWQGTINLEKASNIFEEINDPEIMKSEDYLQHKRKLAAEYAWIKLGYLSLTTYRESLEKHLKSFEPGFFEQVKRDEFPDSNDTKVLASNISKKQ